MTQILRKLAFYFGLLASLMLWGCAGSKPIDLYTRHYQPLISEKKIKKLKDNASYPNKLDSQIGLNVLQAQALHNSLINIYGCVCIGSTEFQRMERLNFITNHIESPRQLAQKVGANYYITYGEYVSRSTSASGNIPRNGALFYLCP